MPAHGYERVGTQDHDADAAIAQSPTTVPASPPPSFRSRASSLRLTVDDRHPRSDEEQTLHDTFDAPSDDDDDDDDDEARDRRQLLHPESGESRHATEPQPQTSTSTPHPSRPVRRVTELPVFAAQPPLTPANSTSAPANDGVFANLSAKTRIGEDSLDEKPPTYEQAAADSPPPFWETAVLSPYSPTGNPDDVFVAGLLVGSVFSFVWNALISMSFQLIGFLLTYLLHTTHAAKHGSRAGLGITLIQYGITMRSSAGAGAGGGDEEPVGGVPAEPDSHSFTPAGGAVPAGGGMAAGGFSSSDWLAYALMIAGWFVLIRGVADFLRARRQEALVRSSPDRGLGVAVVAEGEAAATAV